VKFKAGKIMREKVLKLTPKLVKAVKPAAKPAAKAKKK
jgi:hypothetical protein